MMLPGGKTEGPRVPPLGPGPPMEEKPLPAGPGPPMEGNPPGPPPVPPADAPAPPAGPLMEAKLPLGPPRASPGWPGPALACWELFLRDGCRAPLGPG